MSATWFRGHICAPLRAVEMWESSVLKKFGRIAQESTQLSRTIRSLQTPGGLEKVRNCQASGMPLQGLSEAQPGILECRAIYVQMAKQLAGSAANGVSAAAEIGAADGAGATTTEKAGGKYCFAVFAI